MPPRSAPQGLRDQRGGGPQRGGPAPRGSRGGAARVGTQVGLPSTAGEPNYCRWKYREREIQYITIKHTFKRSE